MRVPKVSTHLALPCLDVALHFAAAAEGSALQVAPSWWPHLWSLFQAGGLPAALGVGPHVSDPAFIGHFWFFPI